MMSVPGIQTRAPAGPVQVRCACGVPLLTLAPGERITRRGDATRVESCTCACGKKTSLPIGRE